MINFSMKTSELMMKNSAKKSFRLCLNLIKIPKKPRKHLRRRSRRRNEFSKNHTMNRKCHNQHKRSEELNVRGIVKHDFLCKTSPSDINIQGIIENELLKNLIVVALIRLMTIVKKRVNVKKKTTFMSHCNLWRN